MKPLILPYKTPMGYYFYETQRNEIVSVSEELYTYIKDDVPDMETSEQTMREYQELVSFGYLAPSHIKELKHPATELVEVALDRKLARILLQVTQRCNLRCEYCVYSETKNPNTRSHANNIMSFETAKKAIDFYSLHSVDAENRTIGFYGGEPLLNFRLIKEVIEYANQVFKGHDIIYSITTNGTLLNDEIIDYLLKHNVKITVSLDGPKEIHDKNRRFSSGKGTFDTVIENLWKLKNRSTREIPFTISMVIDPENNYDDIIKIFEHPVMDGINVFATIVEENETTKRYTEAYYSKFERDLFWGLVNQYRGKTVAYRNKIVSQELIQMQDIIEDFQPNHIGEIAAPAGPCIPGKMRLFIDCFGNLFPCERVSETAEDMMLGTLDVGFNLDRVKTLLNISQLTEDSCKNCWAFSLCTVCAKYAVSGSSLCSKKKLLRCAVAKDTAYSKILHKTLDYENRQHKRKMSCIMKGEA